MGGRERIGKEKTGGGNNRGARRDFKPRRDVPVSVQTAEPAMKFPGVRGRREAAPTQVARQSGHFARLCDSQKTG
jgi:hypothetical protein